MRPLPPDIVLLATEWRPRALLRAQLIEEGWEVVATNTWATMRRHLRPGMTPRLALVDLKGLPDPARVLNDLRGLMKPDHVLLLSALGTLSAPEIERFGYNVLHRPIIIGDVARIAADRIRSLGNSSIRY